MRVIVCKSVRGWHWRLVARNNRAVAMSVNGYADPDSAVQAWRDLHGNLYDRVPATPYRAANDDNPVAIVVSKRKRTKRAPARRVKARRRTA